MAVKFMVDGLSSMNSCLLVPTWCKKLPQILAQTNNQVLLTQVRPNLPYHHGPVILSRHDDNRNSPNTDLTNSESTELDEKQQHLAAQAGISRQQLINRYQFAPPNYKPIPTSD